MDVSDVRRLKALREENGKLKKLLAGRVKAVRRRGADRNRSRRESEAKVAAVSFVGDKAPLPPCCFQSGSATNLVRRGHHNGDRSGNRRKEVCAPNDVIPRGEITFS
jgi:hypothetical protein